MWVSVVLSGVVAAQGKGPTVDAGLRVDAGMAPDAGRVVMAPEVKSLVDRMQAFYEKTQDFSADFHQEYFFKTFKRKQTATGRLSYKKPALMKWEYLVPDVRTLVLAGDRVYAHDPSAKMLTRAAINTNKLSASVTFLFGKGKLADEFSITKRECAACKGTQLELVALVPDPRFQKVYLEVDPVSAQVVKSTVVDPDGSTNTISFLKMSTNVGIDENAFKLSPPPGTQVTDMLGGMGAVPDAGT
jgi:outer membrane lipoprotein carrier protein